MKIDPDKVPSNLEEAIQILKNGLDTRDIEEIKSPQFCSSQMHFGVGMGIRNEWSLWVNDSILVKWFKKTYKVDHADDISGIILECLTNDVRNDPRRDTILAKEFIKHWKKYKK